jgi:hypothetical protein
MHMDHMCCAVHSPSIVRTHKLARASLGLDYSRLCLDPKYLGEIFL